MVAAGCERRFGAEGSFGVTKKRRARSFAFRVIRSFGPAAFGIIRSFGPAAVGVIRPFGPAADGFRIRVQGDRGDV